MAKTLAAIASEPDIILHRQFTMEFLLFIRIKVAPKRIVRADHDGLVIFCPVSAVIRLLVRDGVNTDFFGRRHARQLSKGRNGHRACLGFKLATKYLSAKLRMLAPAPP
jgi:hypothetical protein